MPEPLSIHPEDKTRLLAGMVLCLEPRKDIGTVMVEDMVVVAEHGCQPLSGQPTSAELVCV